MAALVGCRQGARPTPASAPSASATPTSTSLSPNDPTGMRLAKVDMLISQWDVAQAAGRKEQADMLVAPDPPGGRRRATRDFVAAAEGSMGIQTQYLGVSALGFSGRSDATRVLLERLRERDPRLVGNALIALRIRADPNTRLDPVLQQMRSPAVEPRRYAPLVVANVLEAQLRMGRTPDAGTQRQVASALSAIVADRDPLVRLHVANALGKLTVPGTFELLMVLMKDEYVRIRIAAAAGLERLGDARGMPEVIRLLEDVDQELKGIVQDLLVSYAARASGQPLSEATRAELGTSGLAWSRWYTDFAQARGIPLPSSVRSPAASLAPREGPAAPAPGPATAAPGAGDTTRSPGAPPPSPWSAPTAPTTAPTTRAPAPAPAPAPRRVERAPMPSPPPPPPPPPPLR